MTEQSFGYWMTGADNYWVIQRNGYDIIAFSTEKEAQDYYDKLIEFERKARCASGQ